MDNTTFASYKFKPSDVIEGLNRYFAETKANRYLRVPLEIRRGVCYNNPYCVKDIIFTNSPPDRNTRSGHVCWHYYLICDPEEVVGVAINCLREEHDIFYTPGMEVPREDCDIFCEENLDTETVEKLRTELVEARRMYHNSIKERNQFGRRLMDIRKASGMADNDPGDLVEYIETLRKSEAEYEHLCNQYEKMYCELRDAKFTKLSEERDRYKWLYGNLKNEILKIYREIFDCLNGDPEGSDKEVLQDILTEYKRTLELKNVAEEKIIKYKELARENEEKAAKYKEIQEKYSRYCLAVGSLCNIPDERREDISWIEDAFNHTKKDYLKWETTADELARFRSNICTALCLGGETDDEDILKRVRMTKDCHDTLCKDYTELRKAIWKAMDRKPETLPDGNARLVGEVTELARGEKLLIEFRDDVAKAIGMDYQTTNNFILKRVADIYKERGEAHDLAMELDRKCIDLTAKNSDLQQKFEFQSGLRRTWHARYDSEHERANCVQKALDREREKCRVKDISLETAKKQYEKVCGNLETAECALNGMKSKVRSLQEEKTKVISALGQDIWDDAVK